MPKLPPLPYAANAAAWEVINDMVRLRLDGTHSLIHMGSVRYRFIRHPDLNRPFMRLEVERSGGRGLSFLSSVTMMLYHSSPTSMPASAVLASLSGLAHFPAPQHAVRSYPFLRRADGTYDTVDSREGAERVRARLLGALTRAWWVVDPIARRMNARVACAERRVEIERQEVTCADELHEVMRRVGLASTGALYATPTLWAKYLPEPGRMLVALDAILESARQGGRKEQWLTTLSSMGFSLRNGAA